MGVLQAFIVALEMLRLHKLRAFLTMLGVIIGVMSVTIIVMVSNGFQDFMSSEFKKLGSDTIMITFDRFSSNDKMTAGKISGLTMDDVAFIKNRASSIDILAPMVQVGGQKITVGDKELKDPDVIGSDENYLELNRVKIASGRGINASDVRNRSNVAVVGVEVEEKLFGKGKAIGKLIQMKGITLEVVGVFDRVDIMGNSNAKDVLIPLTTVQDKWTGGKNLIMITTRPKPGVKVADAMEQVWQALMLKSGNKKIYRVDSQESLVATINVVFGAAGTILAAVAALALLVGGIGIMNIMLVSVTERTKEIGLRKAMGAKRGSILTQFVVEAATLSLVGGIIGMFFAFVIGKLVTFATAAAKFPSAGGLPTSFPIASAIIAAVFSAFIGVVFGLYPAISASKLDPIVALRRE